MVGAVKRTEAHEETLRRMVADNASDRRIAAELHVNGDTVRRWRRALGLKSGAGPISVSAANPETWKRDRMPLPPGHPASWNALVEGSSLAGMPYPVPLS